MSLENLTTMQMNVNILADQINKQITSGCSPEQKNCWEPYYAEAVYRAKVL